MQYQSNYPKYNKTQPRKNLLINIMLTFIILFSFPLFPARLVYAGSGDIIKNADFETGTLNWWGKWPTTAPGIVAVESCCANHTPGGTWDAYIEPKGSQVVMFQDVALQVGVKYHLEAWASTNGMTVNLAWYSDTGGGSWNLCASTSAVWPNYARLACDFTVPSGTTYMNVQLSGNAPNGKWAVTDDWYLTPIKLHNAVQKNTGNYYGSSAHIQKTTPDLKTGQWTYNRTATVHNNPSTCFRFSEIGWQKTTTTSFKGLIVWDLGCFRQSMEFSITASTHTYGQLYTLGSDGNDRYAWFVDGAYIGNGITNFSYSTFVTCGGEVASGIETMGNTLCYQNEKALRNPDGSYYNIPWGGHSTYVADAPYINVNDSSDPNNAFRSTGPIPGQ